MILYCLRPTESSVILIIHRNVDLKCFFKNFTKMFVCYYRYTIIFMYILQGSVPVKEFRKSVNNIGKDMDKSKVPRFFIGPSCI